MAHDNLEDVYGTKGHQSIVIGEINLLNQQHRYIYLSKTIKVFPSPSEVEFYVQMLRHQYMNNK